MSSITKAKRDLLTKWYNLRKELYYKNERTYMSLTTFIEKYKDYDMSNLWGSYYKDEAIYNANIKTVKVNEYWDNHELEHKKLMAALKEITDEQKRLPEVISSDLKDIILECMSGIVSSDALQLFEVKSYDLCNVTVSNKAGEINYYVRPFTNDKDIRISIAEVKEFVACTDESLNYSDLCLLAAFTVNNATFRKNLIRSLEYWQTVYNNLHKREMEIKDKLDNPDYEN